MLVCKRLFVSAVRYWRYFWTGLPEIESKTAEELQNLSLPLKNYMQEHVVPEVQLIVLLLSMIVFLSQSRHQRVALKSVLMQEIAWY